jgi:methylmalonyl-CoA/ethylmalonyl-CoA epimerase
MKKIDHIGVAVKNLENSNIIFEKLLGYPHHKTENIENQDVLVSFFGLSSPKIELLQPTSQDSVIAKFIAQKGEGVHHIAFEVTDIQEEMNRLKAEGFIILNETPKKGANNKWVVFLHPKTTNGVLIELCQEIQETEL